jgi:hypothetical protein
VGDISEVPEATEMDCTLKIKWKKKKRTFEQAELSELFGKFGPVDTVVMTKQGSGLVVFKSIVGAVSKTSRYQMVCGQSMYSFGFNSMQRLLAKIPTRT